MKFTLSSSNVCEDRSRQYVGMMALLTGTDNVKTRQWLPFVTVKVLIASGKKMIDTDY